MDGAVYLRDLGLPPEVVSLVAYHTGAEFEAEERGLEVELAQIDRPRQDQLDALTLCDLTVSPTGSRVSVRDRLDEVLVRYPEQHPVHRAIVRSRAHLLAACERAAIASGSPEEWGFATL